MAIPRLHITETALLVVDVQARLIGTIHEHETMVRRAASLIRGCALLKVPVIVTEQYVKGLGHTVGEIADALPPGTKPFEKMQFSSLTPGVLAELADRKVRSLLVCGIEAHVCVLQTVLDAAAAGIQPFHATDAISAGQADQIPPAMRRMERAGSVPTGALSALYELMQTCEHPVFREMLGVAKSIVRTGN